MQDPMSVNVDIYSIAIDNTSKAATLAADYKYNANGIFTNLSDEAVFVMCGKSGETAIFPTSSSVPVKGQVIAAGGVQTYNIPAGTTHIYAIQPTSGTGNLYISIDPAGRI